MIHAPCPFYCTLPRLLFIRSLETLSLSTGGCEGYTARRTNSGSGRRIGHHRGDRPGDGLGDGSGGRIGGCILVRLAGRGRGHEPVRLRDGPRGGLSD